ncbi:MAG TPA: hypothetical protein VH851_08900 [Candidatus Binatia bacterium]
MKQKLSVFIEKEVLRLAKRKAGEEGRSLNDLIVEALDLYLRTGATTSEQRKIAAYHLFCQQPMKIAPGQLHYVLDEDTWNR